MGYKLEINTGKIKKTRITVGVLSLLPALLFLNEFFKDHNFWIRILLVAADFLFIGISIYNFSKADDDVIEVIDCKSFKVLKKNKNGE